MHTPMLTFRSMLDEKDKTLLTQIRDAAEGVAVNQKLTAEALVAQMRLNQQEIELRKGFLAQLERINKGMGFDSGNATSRRLGYFA